MFTIDFSDIERLEREWDEATGMISDGIRLAVRKGLDAGEMEARSTHRYKDRTGRLTDNIRGRLEVSVPGGAVGTLGAFTPYASFVADGTDPHEIHPKAGHGMIGPVRRGQSRRATGKGPHEHIVGRGLFLRWKDAGGVVHFARMVRHPGTAPDDFMRNAVIKTETVITREIEASIARAKTFLDQR